MGPLGFPSLIWALVEFWYHSESFSCWISPLPALQVRAGPRAYGLLSDSPQGPGICWVGRRSARSLMAGLAPWHLLSEPWPRPLLSLSCPGSPGGPGGGSHGLWVLPGHPGGGKSLSWGPRPSVVHKDCSDSLLPVHEASMEGTMSVIAVEVKLLRMDRPVVKQRKGKVTV